MKILHVIKSLGRGGAETLLPETLKLHSKEFEFHYIYFLPWKDQMAEGILQHGGIVSCFDANNNLQLLLKARAVARYIKKNDIQLIHAHLPWAGFLARLVGKMSGIPVIYTEHNKQERYHRLTFLFNRLTFNWQKEVIAVSDDVAVSIQKNIHPRIPVRTILNGVNTESFRRDNTAGQQLRKELGIPSDAIVIGTIAVFRFQKRLAEWLSVVSEVVHKFPNVYGIIVGDGPLRTEIEEKRKALGLEHKVLMPGLQTEVQPWLSAIDIYMMTSIFEGLPIALLEAMSMECAVVSTDAGGIKELIRHEQDGLLTPVEKWNSLSAICEKLVTNSIQRKALGRAARERVVGSFSLRRMVNELEELYLSMIK